MKVLIFATFMACAVYVYSQSVNCPELKEKDPVMVTHPCNCSTYYVCMPPQPVPMPCPRGLHFHPPSQRCEWPWIAKCVPQNGCPPAFFGEDEFFEEQAHL